MGGKIAIEELLKMNSGAKAIVSSGYADKHPSPSNAMKLFFSKNRTNKMALESIGLTSLLKEKK